jgi:hypothetical protein
MSCATALHNLIEQYNVLTGPTDQMNDYLHDHPDLYKTALILNHLFRAASMTTFMFCLPLPFVLSAGICLAGSIFYRLTVENNCAYKFALPAFGGSAAFLMGQVSLAQLISGVAFASLETVAAALTSLLPLATYMAYVILTVSYDVDQRI